MPKKMAGAEADVPVEDIRQFCGDLPDWKISAIAALRPSLADLELALGWAGDRNTDESRSGLSGIVSRIGEILEAGEDDDVG